MYMGKMLGRRLSSEEASVLGVPGSLSYLRGTVGSIIYINLDSYDVCILHIFLKFILLSETVLFLPCLIFFPSQFDGLSVGRGVSRSLNRSFVTDSYLTCSFFLPSSGLLSARRGVKSARLTFCDPSCSIIDLCS